MTDITYVLMLGKERREYYFKDKESGAAAFNAVRDANSKLSIQLVSREVKQVVEEKVLGSAKTIYDFGIHELIISKWMNNKEFTNDTIYIQLLNGEYKGWMPKSHDDAEFWLNKYKSDARHSSAYGLISYDVNTGLVSIYDPVKRIWE